MRRMTQGARDARKKKGEGHVRREEILEAAFDLFGRQDPRSVSTRRIAQVIGISQSTLYAYFESKQAIVAELRRKAQGDLTQKMQAMLRVDLGQNALEAMLRVYLEFGLANPEAYKIAFLSDDRAAEGVVWPGRIPSIADDVIHVLLQGLLIRDVSVTGPCEAFLARSTWASMHGLVHFLLNSPDLDQSDRDQLVELHVARATTV